MIALCIGLWLASGIASFIYWWTWDYDFTTKDLFPFAFAALMGPISFAVGAMIHGGGSNTTIIKRRKP